jgi:16S rRNA (uracil1498-N3)-methyltransferase
VPHRFHLPPDQCHDSLLSLTGREAHHALHVLRLRTGDHVTVLDGAGQELQCELHHSGRDSLSLAVLERRSIPPFPYQLTLLQALPKGKLIESIIEKATELGAARIVPLLSEHVVTALKPAQAAQKAGKWQLVAVEAIKQCGAPWLPRVETPVSIQQFLGRKEVFELALIGSLQPGSRHPRECFQQFHQQHGRKPRTVCVWVGPEGDFTPSELEAIRSSGALPITLGPLVLRSETAAIYSLSILGYELQAK